MQGGGGGGRGRCPWGFFLVTRGLTSITSTYRSTSTVVVSLYTYSTSTVPLQQYLYSSTSSVSLRYLYGTFTVPLQYLYNSTFTVPVQYLSSTSPISLQHLNSTSALPLHISTSSVSTSSLQISTVPLLSSPLVYHTSDTFTVALEPADDNRRTSSQIFRRLSARARVDQNRRESTRKRKCWTFHAIQTKARI